ncbi:DUF421 domain-containing protein [Pontibacillus salipaludis]|uniref:DUF421 domain-containing protein n=1 Tax=Pontibacillus salipaludis TaxID=1697394 RepID=UPI0031E629EA
MIDETLVVVVRVIFSFFTLLIFTRVLGKQEVGQLTFFDYINGITIGSIAANLATDLSATTWGHWVGLTGYALLTMILQVISMKSRYLGKVLEGEPTVVVKDGKILEDNLKKMRIKVGELMMLLRQRGVFNITDVEFALIEVNGKLSVLPKSQYLPVTPSDLRILTNEGGIATELIQEGQLIPQNLQQKNVTQEWIEEQLKQQGIDQIEDVFYALYLPNGKLYVDLYEEQVGEEEDISDYPGPY